MMYIRHCGSNNWIFFFSIPAIIDSVVLKPWLSLVLIPSSPSALNALLVSDMFGVTGVAEKVIHWLVNYTYQRFIILGMSQHGESFFVKWRILSLFLADNSCKISNMWYFITVINAVRWWFMTINAYSTHNTSLGERRCFTVVIEYIEIPSNL